MYLWHRLQRTARLLCKYSQQTTGSATPAHRHGTAYTHTGTWETDARLAFAEASCQRREQRCSSRIQLQRWWARRHKPPQGDDGDTTAGESADRGPAPRGSGEASEPPGRLGAAPASPRQAGRHTGLQAPAGPGSGPAPLPPREARPRPRAAALGRRPHGPPRP